ncbi:hypothetical protein GCM10010429_24500 [Micromonospora olivasterospora]|uniref:Uncharacterized protein n=1 Tax=Micromonospora olivasterospora TaxID=1880 RepID=A0A562IIM8_MICOL|nr:hypothetical protein JD77_05600 [Micromonospora olivasterospora]
MRSGDIKWLDTRCTGDTVGNFSYRINRNMAETLLTPAGPVAGEPGALADVVDRI